MRVISGIAKGHKLSAPSGIGTRPTADKVKEALFSIVQASVEGSTVLDLFAGSGALGIEALSRGAGHCDFVDESRSAETVIRDNLQKTRFENYTLHVQNAMDFLKKCDKKYDLVLLDPPYNKSLCDKALSILSQRSLVAEGGIIACEVSADEEVSSPFAEVKRYKYGTVGLIIFENV